MDDGATVEGGHVEDGVGGEEVRGLVPMSGLYNPEKRFFLG